MNNKLESKPVSKLSIPEGRPLWGLYHVLIDYVMYKQDTLSNGLLLMYPKRFYSRPAGIRFLVDPRVLASDEDGDYYIPEGDYVIGLHYGYCERLGKVLNVHILQPKRIIHKPRYALLFLKFPYRHTCRGGKDTAYVLKRQALWYDMEISGCCGTHGYYYYLLMIKEGEGGVVRTESISNSGRLLEQGIHIYMYNNGKITYRYKSLI